MKSLFITYNSIDSAISGGSQCSKRNFDLLSKYFDVDCYQIKKRTSFGSLLSLFSGYYPPLSIMNRHEIKRLLISEKYDVVFLDSSLLGGLTKVIRESCGALIVSFFHNIEVDYVRVRFYKHKLRLMVYSLSASRNERKSIIHSDLCIGLNSRDHQRAIEIYSKGFQHIIPITFKPLFSHTELELKYKNLITLNADVRTCLFVGSYVSANFQGISWFIENVMPNIDVKLIIIGSGFELVKDRLESNNIEVHGFVESLDDYYLSADCVIAPLFIGGGMKVKVAEAMMYGKHIFGTSEAFEGYEVEFSRIGAVCDSADKFIEEMSGYLASMDCGKFNRYSRQIFDQKYSTDLVESSLKDIIDSAIN